MALLAGLLAVSIVTFIILVQTDSPTIAGTWVGAADGATVLYHFDLDGSGHRIIAGRRQDLRYEFEPGYPNLIRIRIGDLGDAAVVNGLLEIVSDTRLRLELSPPGEPPPRQLTSAALDLRRPATR